MKPRDSDTEAQQLAALKPGGLLHYDYRTAPAKRAKLPEEFRVVQWNIERGVQFDRIVETLRAVRADILLLQEVDINCRRSGYRNVARDLAEALQMQLYFVCEFEELDAVDRAPEHAVSSLSPPAVNTAETHPSFSALSSPPALQQQCHFHGNAILSARATLSDPFVFPHSAGIDWEKEGWKLHEPRHGFRSVLRCRIAPDQRTSTLLPDVFLYCCHFEVFCGALSRVRQLLDVFRDASRLLQPEERQKLRDPHHHHHQQQQQQKQKQQQQRNQPAFIIGGDLNTMADGVVRLSRRFGGDRLRILGVGEKEACWLQRKVLSRRMDHVTRGCCPFSYRYPLYAAGILHDRLWNSDCALRLVYGFSREEVAALDNRRLCFYDPGDKALSTTLDHPDYHGFVRGKLDWLLLSNLRVAPPDLAEEALAALLAGGSIAAETASCVRQLQQPQQQQNHGQRRALPRDGYVLFNEKFDASDHRGLLLHVRQHVGLPQEVYPEYGATYTTSWVNIGFFTLTRTLPWAFAAWLLYKRRQRQV
ncbi:hypothetical protein DQ04_04501010 [Trypanosoma grayi]|uniref:hypothetical protein n=1 Tax=Trypanosoma grayi TaxID=71804 RepID=UPI0004F4BE67|nr:hypothetical protein DQ04_04501010 [Trypanosoma grayi]KEG09875.1 hypothetical protein DQ04_04501010 [Trypanosoma grayi]